MAKFCPKCAHPIIDNKSQFCPKCGAKHPTTSSVVQQPPTQKPAVQQPAYSSPSSEYRRTCKNCGKVWHSLVSREKYLEDKKSKQKVLLCFTAATNVATRRYSSDSVPFLYTNNVHSLESSIDGLRKCPDCGSSNYYEEILTYEKE